MLPEAVVGMVPGAHALTPRAGSAYNGSMKMIKSSQLLSLTVVERTCAQDVCEYCVGACPPYSKDAEGPNEAANWIHPDKEEPLLKQAALCKASGIYQRVYHRESLEWGERQKQA